MGLQVWLPLTKDLHNQGLLNTTATVSGTTSFVAGKLGQALNCNGSSYWILPNITLGSEVSITCWAKTTVNGKMPWVLNADSVTLLNLYVNTYYCLNNADSNNNPFKDSSGNTIAVLTDGLWHHYTVTFGSNIAKLYIDGEYSGTALTFRNPTSTNTTIKLAGGYRDAHSYDWNGAISDFRVYDNCLSEKEIKEIAKGLILYYPFNRRGLGNENLIVGTDDWSTWYKGNRWSASNGVLTYSAGSVSWIDADSPCIPWADIDGKTITVSCELRSDDFNYTSGSGFSLCLVRKATEAVQNYANRRRECTPIYKTKNEITSTWQRFSHTYINFSDSTFTNTYNGGGGDWFGIYLWNYTDKSVQVRNIKVEFGDKVTPYCPNSIDTLYSQMNLGALIEYDYSGFNNNGTYNLSPTFLLNAPKYQISTYFGGVNTPKVTLNDPSILTVLNNCSISWWENCSTTSNTLLFSGQTQYYYIAAGNNSNPLYDYNIGTSGITLYKDGVAVNTSYNGQRVNHTGTYHIKDEWHHYVLTGIDLSTWTTFIINGYSSWPLNSYISDVRIYATALSATDVLSLYQNNAYIDQSGQIYGPVR